MRATASALFADPGSVPDPGRSILEERERARRAHPPSRPLGLLPDAVVAADQLAALRVIESYDLGVVRERLICTGGMTPGWADEAIFEFRRYLGLRAVFPDPITMLSADIDEVWHACVLHTRLYTDLCDRVFGHFLHHDPETELNPDRDARWHEFETAYRSIYGEPGPLWEMWRLPSVAESRPNKH